MHDATVSGLLNSKTKYDFTCINNIHIKTGRTYQYDGYNVCHPGNTQQLKKMGHYDV